MCGLDYMDYVYLLIGWFISGLYDDVIWKVK
jgi:hypothetical protein